MKKTIIAFAAASFFAAVSCSVESLEPAGNETETSVAEVITKIMTVEPGIWTPADTKTAYTPEVGIDWTGDEQFVIYYGANGNDGSVDNPYMRYAATVDKTENNVYSFKHASIDGVGQYDYAVITPYIYSKNGNVDATGNALNFKFSPIQMPGDDGNVSGGAYNLENDDYNTYDPNFDVLFGKGVKGVEQSSSLTVEGFKRVSTPLKFELAADGEVLTSDDKIFAVTASFSQAPAENAALSGLASLNFGVDDYAACNVSKIQNGGNALTALYPKGLAQIDGVWPVWFSVLPAEIAAGSSLTLTVVTASNTITQTISGLPEMKIEADKFNTVKVKVSGEAVSSLYWDFRAIENIMDSNYQNKLTASDGKKMLWGFSNNIMLLDGDPYSQYLSVPNGSITLPEIPDPALKIKKIRIYTHPCNASSGATVALNDNAPVSISSWTADGLSSKGGVLEIDVPASEPGRPVLNISGGEVCISGISFEYGESTTVTYSPDQLKIGDYFYSDGTWSDGGLRVLNEDGTFEMADEKPAPEAGKTVVGIVFQTNPERFGSSEKNCFGISGTMKGLVMSVKNVPDGPFGWGLEGQYEDIESVNCAAIVDCYNDISGLGNYNNIYSFRNDRLSEFPAFNAVNEFNKSWPVPSSPTGWFLPSAGQWWDILQILGGCTPLADPQVQTSSDAVETSNTWALEEDDFGNIRNNLNSWMSEIAAGDKDEFTNAQYYTSSEYNKERALSWKINDKSAVLYRYMKYQEYQVRPVIAF